MACVGQTSMQALQLPQWSDDRRARRQGDVDEDLAEEEHRAGVAVEHERVLAAPADAAPGRELDLEHRRRIGEDAMAERPDRRGELVGELAQALAQHLVIVAAAGIDRDRRRRGVGEAAPFDRLPARRGLSRQVVEPRGDHAQRARRRARPAGRASCRAPPCSPSRRENRCRARRPGAARPSSGRCRRRRSGKIRAHDPRPAAARARPGRREEEDRSLVESSILETRYASWPDEAACADTARTIAGHHALHDAFIELHGPLGAGKTTFARHLLHGARRRRRDQEPDLRADGAVPGRRRRRAASTSPTSTSIASTTRRSGRTPAFARSSRIRG